MDYEITTSNGKNISYKLIGHSGIPVEVSIHEKF